MRETMNKLMAGKLDTQLVYRKRLRRPLSEYQRNVPPHVRAARLCSMKETISAVAPCNIRTAGTVKSSYGPPTARSRWTTNVQPLDFEHYLDPPATTRGGGNIPLY